MENRKVEISSHQVYLWVKLADVITLLTEVEELRKKKLNKETLLLHITSKESGISYNNSPTCLINYNITKLKPKSAQCAIFNGHFVVLE